LRTPGRGCSAVVVVDLPGDEGDRQLEALSVGDPMLMLLMVPVAGRLRSRKYKDGREHGGV